jgi:hypothetical protein
MNLAAESPETRRDAFTIAGERRGLLPMLIEKDFDTALPGPCT